MLAYISTDSASFGTVTEYEVFAALNPVKSYCPFIPKFANVATFDFACGCCCVFELELLFKFPLLLLFIVIVLVIEEIGTSTPLFDNIPSCADAVIVVVPEFPTVTVTDCAPPSIQTLFVEIFPFDTVKFTLPTQSEETVTLTFSPASALVLLGIKDIDAAFEVVVKIHIIATKDTINNISFIYFFIICSPLLIIHYIIFYKNIVT